MSLEAWGDDGFEGPDGYVTEERADEMVREAIEELQAELARATAPIKCGTTETVDVSSFTGCGRDIAYRNYYRCTSCDVRMHKHCLEQHFGNEPPGCCGYKSIA